MDILRGLFGVAILLGIAFLFSENRKSIDYRLVLVGLLLQVTFGLLVTQVEWVQAGFLLISSGFVKILDFSVDGAAFLFGDLARNSEAGEKLKHNMGFLFAFQVLPTIVFFSTLSAGLYYLGLLQKIVKGIAWVMVRTMGLSGAESLSAAGNIFLGQTEAPLLVRPFIKNMSRSEIICLMTGGMATIAGGVLAAYVSFLGGSDPQSKAQFASFLLGASIMNAPAGIVLSKILVPEQNTPSLGHGLEMNKEKFGSNLLDSISQGATNGVKLAVNVGGMLLAFVALIALLNYLFSALGGLLGINKVISISTQGIYSGLSLEYLLGQIFRPLAFIMGIDWNETILVGSLLGKKTVINEFVAYLDLGEMKADALLSQKSLVISTFALCGFSNFSSIAIQLGGIGAMAPNKQKELSELGLRALLGASLACMLTATWAGIFLT